MLTEYQRQLRDRCLAAPVMPTPAPWRPVLGNGTAVGGLLGNGFATHPDTGHDLVMVVSTDGHGLFDAVSGERIAGLFGGGLHTGASGGWTVDVVSPEWPHDRVVLSTGHGIHKGQAGEAWWHIFDADYSELRAAGFSPSGRTLAVATSSDLTPWTRPAPH
ncbi:hypothetical protein ACWDG9_27375 [Streptomyces sp. NPDC001073]